MHVSYCVHAVVKSSRPSGVGFSDKHKHFYLSVQYLHVLTAQALGYKYHPDGHTFLHSLTLGLQQQQL